MAIGRTNAGFGGGGSGGTLVVTAPAGVTVTISKDDKTKRKMAGQDGQVTFKGLKTGTWSVVISDEEKTSPMRNVEVVADYAVTMAFFAATIAVTYPEGSTCTCTNGSITLTATTTTGSYSFIVGSTGTWTVSCTDGTDTATDTVEITADGQSESVELSYILYLYKSGDQSGWTKVATSAGNPGFTVEYGESAMTTHLSAWCSESGYAAYIYKNVKISGKKTLKVKISSAWFSAVSAADSNDCGTLMNLQVYQGSTKVAEKEMWGNFTTSSKSYGEETNTIDISSLSGEYQVRIFHSVYIYHNTAAQVQGKLYISEISAT